MSTQSPAEVLGPVVTAIDHVGFAVRDLDAAIAFYGRAFGLPLVHQEINEEQGVARGDGRHRRLVHPAALPPLRPDSAIGKFLERNGEGIQQMAFRVTDVEVAGAAPARRRACACCTTRPRRGTAGSRVNFVHPKDAGGVLVELVEPAAEH